ncbi:hypothetical protein A2215_04670 [Candidatus Berkelbacteria bacterium RIFOXYA2_FULL_43_10]|uniref:Transcription regulator TrmB N-terminal domain-containing protein n=1 Tax=Candidatus Berkelbacteria bacterium RIFOXYA2_FULL_43_10 TaxID=1797472 RepID=A0A1F5EEM5_9BACT|nr:MAG: hypothetical protein A2215_04670 [Candidatus Berkelbacteria bacterium RIFOXYA2_FULL_43_10]
MSNKLVSLLTELEFNEKEANVFLSLAKIGQTSAGEIIKSTGYHRNVVYTALDKLITRKLAFKVIRKNITYYQISDPNRIKEEAKEKLKASEYITKTLSQYIDSALPEITIHEGVEAYKSFWFSAYRALPVGSIDYVAGSIGEKWLEFLGNDDVALQELRRERKIVWKMVIFDKNDFETTLLKSEPKLNQCRLIDKKDASKDGNFNVFNDDCVVLHSAAEPMIIGIKSKSLAKVFRNIFDLLWEQGKRL